MAIPSASVAIPLEDLGDDKDMLESAEESEDDLDGKGGLLRARFLCRMSNDAQFGLYRLFLFLPFALLLSSHIFLVYFPSFLLSYLLFSSPGSFQCVRGAGFVFAR